VFKEFILVPNESLFLFSSGVTIILGCFAQTKKHLLAEIIKYPGNLFQKSKKKM
jgi:hypothetical protein